MNLPTSYIYLWLLTALSFPPCSLGFVIYAFNFCRLNRKTLRFIGGHGKRFQFVVFLHTRQYFRAEICVSFQCSQIGLPNINMYIYIFVLQSLGCVWVYIMLNCPFQYTWRLSWIWERHRLLCCFRVPCLSYSGLQLPYFNFCLLFRENWNSSCWKQTPSLRLLAMPRRSRMTTLRGLASLSGSTLTPAATLLGPTLVSGLD